MRKQLLAIVLSLVGYVMMAQPPMWQMHLSWAKPRLVEDMPQEVLFSSGDILAIRKIGYPVEYSFFDRQDGISDIGIAQIAYHPESATALIYYVSGKIDLLDKNGLFGIRAIYDNFRVNDKTLNEIVFMDEYALLAGNFGLSLLNMTQKTIDATAFAGSAIESVFVWKDRIYILVDNELRSCAKNSHNLQDPTEWRKEKTFSQDVTRTILFDGRIFAHYATRELVSWNADNMQEAEKQEHKEIEKLFTTRYHFVWVDSDKCEVRTNNSDAPIVLVNGRKPLDVSSNTNPNELWIADGYNFYRYKLDSPIPDKEYYTIYDDSPLDNNYFYATAQSGRYYAVSGARTHDRGNVDGMIKIKDGNHWTNIEEGHVMPTPQLPFLDIVSIVADSRDKKHFFAGSWGEGLYEFRDDKLYKHYHLDNSPLLSALPNNADKDRYVRVGSLAWDERNKLWLAQGSATTPIWSLSDKGEWTGYAYPEIAENNSFGKMTALPGGVKWLLIHHRGSGASNGVFLFDDHNTPDLADDDKLFVSQFADRSGKLIAATEYYDMAIDHNGSAWIGTNKGPICVHNASRVLRNPNPPIAVRPIGGKEPNLFYVLDNVPASAIAVDHLNNKWIGTLGDGLYLLSEDGTETLGHWTSNNSPLVNDVITSLVLEPESSILYVGTPTGLMTLYLGDGNTFAEIRNNAYVYPNPLRPEDPDKITLAGLEQGCTVRIVDVAGRLLFTQQALTSELSFTPRMPNGERYPSGVYQAVIASPQGDKSYVLRFTIVR